MRTAHTPLLVVAAAVIAVGLSACAPARGAIGEPAPSGPTVSSNASSTTPSPPAVEAGAAFDIPCEQLLTDDEIFQFNNNIAYDPNYSPAAGSLAADVVAKGGTACGWLNLSGGDHIEIAVATPDQKTLAARKESASAGTPTVGVGDEGYFSTNGDNGQLQVFVGPYWLTAESLYFSDMGEGNQLVYTVVAHLP